MGCKPSADGKNIINQLDDNTKVIFRMDVGVDVHKIKSQGYNEPVNPVNIEIHTRTPKVKYNPKWDLPIILDDSGSVKDYFITGQWKNK